MTVEERQEPILRPADGARLQAVALAPPAHALRGVVPGHAAAVPREQPAWTADWRQADRQVEQTLENPLDGTLAPHPMLGGTLVLDGTLACPPLDGVGAPGHRRYVRSPWAVRRWEIPALPRPESEAIAAAVPAEAVG